MGLKGKHMDEGSQPNYTLHLSQDHYGDLQQDIGYKVSSEFYSEALLGPNSDQ